MPKSEAVLITFSNVKLGEEKLRNASQILSVLDARQYYMCIDYKSVKEDTPSFKVYQFERDEMLDAITALVTMLSVFATDPVGQQNALDSAVRRVQRVLGLDDLTAKHRKDG